MENFEMVSISILFNSVGEAKQNPGSVNFVIFDRIYYLLVFPVCLAVGKLHVFEN